MTAESDSSSASSTVTPPPTSSGTCASLPAVTGFFHFCCQLARHGVGAFVLAVGTAVPDLDAVKPAHYIVEPVRVCAVLKGMRDDRQPALCVNGRDRLGKLPRFDGFSHKETQQMPALGRNLGRGDDEKIVEFRNLVQHAVVVADGDTVQPRSRASATISLRLMQPSNDRSE